MCGCEIVASYDRRLLVLRCSSTSRSIGLRKTVIGYLATMFAAGVAELWHILMVEEILSVPNRVIFNMGVVVTFMGAVSYDV